jgi:hypothetical protein
VSRRRRPVRSSLGDVVEIMSVGMTVVLALQRVLGFMSRREQRKKVEAMLEEVEHPKKSRD